jgi:vacuolar-type H+-ATPase subunit I/STV1
MGESSDKDIELNLKIVQDTNKRIRKKLESLKEEKEKRISELEKEISEKESQIKRLKKKLNRARRDEEVLSATSAGRQSREGRGNVHSREDSASPSTRVQQPSKDQLTTKVGQVFAERCRSAGVTMVDRHTMFADQLKERLPEAEVDRVFREKNAAGVFFVEDAQDAVEYWVVRAQGRDLLLPQPNRSGFREVEQCFEGENLAPKEVEEIYPGELRSEKGKQVLKAKGFIS